MLNVCYISSNISSMVLVVIVQPVLSQNLFRAALSSSVKGPNISLIVIGVVSI